MGSVLTILLVGCLVGGMAGGCWRSVALIVGSVVGMAVVGVVKEDSRGSLITADRQRDDDGHPKVFLLSYGEETVTLEPGKLWSKVDVFKWVVRGLIEEPRSFHVFPNGDVEVNGEKIGLAEPGSCARLEAEINKRHPAPVVPRPSVPSPAPHPHPGAPPAGPARQAHFTVRLDRLSHLLITCARGEERVETGLRGLHTFIDNGLMLKPKIVRVDPLQRSLEIDGVHFECNEAGAQQLEAALNARYAPTIRPGEEHAIEVRENPASPTGLDLHFVTAHFGVRHEVKGHLSQDILDILQDNTRCGLLHPDIVLRMSSPYMLIRRKRADGGEEKIPELPDVQYRQTAAVQLERILNHPLIRRTGAQVADKPATAGTQDLPTAILELRIGRQAQDHSHLWLDCLTTDADQPEAKAFTHHNVADLQHRGIFRESLNVTLSLDNRTLSIVNKETGEHQSIEVDTHSSDESLQAASRLLTSALKPPVAGRTAGPGPSPTTGQALATVTPVPTPRPAASDDKETPPTDHPLKPGDLSPPPDVSLVEPPVTPAAPVSATETAIALPKEAAAAATGARTRENEPPRPLPEAPPLDPTLLALFTETDPVRINAEIFRRLVPRFGVPVQDVRLSLPRVFEDREFEIISFNPSEIESVLELRGEDFFGFYLAHINEHNLLLVYACKGRHIEWGTQRCVLQPSVSAEASEFKGSALLGMAQDRANQFVFVVVPAYLEWMKPLQSQYNEVFARFATVQQLAANPEEYTLLWPERPAAAT